MNRINYSKNVSLTDCNYSFCEDKENLSPNALDDLTRILKRHYQLHLKNAHTIRQQASQIQRMQAAIVSIESKLSCNSHNTISSISKRESNYQQSTEYFPNKPTTNKRNRSASSRQSISKTTSVNRHQTSNNITSSITNTISNYSNHSQSSSDSDSSGNAKLLSSIV